MTACPHSMYPYVVDSVGQPCETNRCGLPWDAIKLQPKFAEIFASPSSRLLVPTRCQAAFSLHTTLLDSSARQDLFWRMVNF